MLRCCFRVPVLVAGSLCLLMSTHAQAAIDIVIHSSPPAIPRGAVITPPRGHAECHWVKPGFYGRAWVTRYRVCHYNRPGGGTWVSGHFICTKFRHGACQRWEWSPAHWRHRPRPRIDHHRPHDHRWDHHRDHRDHQDHRDHKWRHRDHSSHWGKDTGHY